MIVELTKIQTEQEETGSKSTDKIKNIFDLYGLRREWTMEAHNMLGRVYRGGYYSTDNSPSHCYNYNTYFTYAYYGSRTSLYIQ